MFAAIMKTNEWLMYDLSEPKTLLNNSNSNKRWVYTEFVFNWNFESVDYFMTDTETHASYNGTLKISPDNQGTFKHLEFGGKADGQKQWGGNGNSQVIDDIKVEWIERKESFYPGETATVYWDPLIDTNQVQLLLFKGEQRVASIANVSASAGSFDWTVDLFGNEPGNDFAILVTYNTENLAGVATFGIEQEEFSFSTSSSSSGNSTWDGHLMDHEETNMILQLLNQIANTLKGEIREKEESLTRRRNKLEESLEEYQDSVSHHQQIISEAKSAKNHLEGKIDTVKDEIELLSQDESAFEDAKQRYHAQLELIAKIRALITGGEQCNDNEGCPMGQGCDYGVCRMLEGAECSETAKCMSGLKCFNNLCVSQVPV
eukprot:gb/GECH01012230.1/.p1 GENE.gb/GECH01012230.1/~~gb/GECH01012230.1/.p1  ORF type:complete len:374 (+),score=82.52 gb/GECH01012230.1/:1-1122(+)